MYKVMYINIFHCFYFIANKINNYLLYFIYIPIVNLYRYTHIFFTRIMFITITKLLIILIYNNIFKKNYSTFINLKLRVKFIFKNFTINVHLSSFMLLVLFDAL